MPPRRGLCCCSLAVAARQLGLVLLLFSSLHLLRAPAAAACSDAAALATGNNNNGVLAAGQALTAAHKLVSANGKFALGFFRFRHQSRRPAGDTNTNSTTVTVYSRGWYLGIWFDKIPVCTPVWVANRERPVAGSELKAARLELSSDDGNLVVVVDTNSTTTTTNNGTIGGGGGSMIIWSSNATTSVNTTSTTVAAVLRNTGNLAVVVVTPPASSTKTTPSTTSDEKNETVLWQSFDDPTDVGLPTARIGRNRLTGPGSRSRSLSFVSKRSFIDPGPGSYSIGMDLSAGLHLSSRAWPSAPPYWTWSGGGLAELVHALEGLMAWDTRTRGLLVPTYRDDPREVYFSYNLTRDSASVFVSIDVFGQLKLNVWSEGKAEWETVYAQPSDFCTPSAVCGPFTLCNGATNKAATEPDCSCMESFSLKSPGDWDLGDHTGGCARNTPLDCRARSNGRSAATSTDGFLPIASVTLPYDAQVVIGGAATESECMAACLGNCSCTAYSYNNSRCSYWHGDLLNVDLNDGNGISSQDVLYLRLAATDLQSSMGAGNKGTSPRVVVAASVVASSILVLLLLHLLVVWRSRFRCCSAPLHDIQGGGGCGGGGGIVAFRYADLCHATRNFSDRLGGGGFGSVFKGVFGDSTAVAVKRLDGARQGEKQFRAEVSSIGMIQHINLVKLVGFCSEWDKRLLVYEHMVNGSLDAHLFQTSATTVLNWSTRYQIAIGVARGLCYLHESCRECIIHCDIKPENILLDASFVPKIADFGMAAFVGRDFSRVLTTFRGTAGYLAPEWLSGVAVTPKVDVYSFGMVLLEIMSGKRNTPEAQSKSSYRVAYFPVQAIRKLHEGDLQSLVDPRLKGDVNLEEAERICRVAFWCIQDDDCDRPTMAEVVRVLEGLQELDMPPMPRLLAAITEHSGAALV